MLDLIINRGRVVDGSGGPSQVTDIGLKDGLITALGNLDPNHAQRVIEAQGRVVAPGFIDMHSHADFSLPAIPTADSLVRQGITSAVVGQCGFSPAPLAEETKPEIMAMVKGLFKALAEATPWERWSSFGEYLEFLDSTRTSVNVIPLVGQGVIRIAVMGLDPAPADETRMAAMKEYLAEAMKAGAFGLSTGLIYPPGNFTATEELIEISKPLAETGGIYFSHIRGESNTLIAALEEALRIGREAGVPVQISHFKAAGRPNWEKSAEALALLDKARAEGVDVTMDMYPYLAGHTSLTALLPDWAHEGGAEPTIERLGDPAQRAKMRADMQTGGFARDVDWDQVLICSSPQKPEWEGRFVDKLAEEAGTDGPEWVFEALFQTQLRLTMAIFGMSQENRNKEICHPEMMIGTDGEGLVDEGPFAEGKCHPRSFGTYPRILKKYVREEGILSLEEAIKKMTSLPAKRLGLTDRGRIEAGRVADLVIFDPETIADTATYDTPYCFPEGIDRVLVAGEVVVENNAHTGARPGRVLRRQDYLET